jgi:hypothetical protein
LHNDLRTQSAEEVLACRQSGQDDCAAARTAKSTGGNREAGQAWAGGTEDPEGAFTSVYLFSTVPGQMQVEMNATAGWQVGDSAELLLAGQVRVPATMLDSPVVWRMVGANSAICDR